MNQLFCFFSSKSSNFFIYLPLLYCFLTHKVLFSASYIASCASFVFISWHSEKDALLREVFPVALFLLSLYPTSTPPSLWKQGIHQLLISHFNAFKLFQFPHLKIQSAVFNDLIWHSIICKLSFTKFLEKWLFTWCSSFFEHHFPICLWNNFGHV